MTLLGSVSGVVIAVAVMSAFVCAPIHAFRHEIKSSIDVGGLLQLHKNLALTNSSEPSRKGGKSPFDVEQSKMMRVKKQKQKTKKGKKLVGPLVFPGVPLERGIFSPFLMHTFKGEFGEFTRPYLMIQTNTHTNKRRCFALLKKLGKGAEGTVFLLVELVEIPSSPQIAIRSSGGETSELCAKIEGEGLECPAIHKMSSRNEIRKYCSDLGRKGLACYAVKMMRFGNTSAKILNSVESIRNEIGIQLKCADKNVVPLVEAWESGNRKFYIMMEYATEGSLSRLVGGAHGGTLGELQAKALFNGILHGVNAMHKQGFAHRDIKMLNVMVTRHGHFLVPKIGDFGSAELVTKKTRDAKRDFDKAVAGTPSIMAPEVVGLSCKDPMKADVWALGVTLYNMLVGSEPFEADNIMRTMALIGHPGIEKPYFGHLKATKFLQLSPLAQNFIKKMLNREPEDRITCSDALLDPWLSMFHEKSLAANM